MVHVKDYETVSTFVKVMQKKTVASFFRTRCIMYIHVSFCCKRCIVSYVPEIINVGWQYAKLLQ